VARGLLLFLAKDVGASALRGVATSQHEARKMAMRRRRIMLVDDEERLLFTSKRLFERLNVDVTTASNGRDALCLLNEIDVDVVLLDVKMPGMDGLETLSEIKKAHPLVEVVLVTGHASYDDAVQGLKLGAMDYLLKPVCMKDLLSKVEEAFAKRHEREKKIRSAECER
jgi:DNA-binding NtrC family response regulator